MRKLESDKTSNSIISGIILTITMPTFALFLFKFDLTSLIFDKHKVAPSVKTMNKAQYQEVAKIWYEQQKANQIENVGNIKPVDNPEKNTQQNVKQYPREAIFKYTDENGLITMVDDIDKVPIRYRKNMKISDGLSEQQRTPVDVVNNQIYVPVSMTYQGRTVTAKLLLDTGATGITISQALAQRLGARPTSQGISILADGRKVQTYQFVSDRVSVGSKNKNAAIVSIIPREGAEETGLLGMSFLAEFPYTIDLKARVIKWF